MRNRKAILTVLMLMVSFSFLQGESKIIEKKYRKLISSGHVLELNRLLELSGYNGGVLKKVTVAYNMIRSNLGIEWLVNNEKVSQAPLDRGLKKTVFHRFDRVINASTFFNVGFTGPKGNIQLLKITAEIEIQSSRSTIIQDMRVEEKKWEYVEDPEKKKLTMLRLDPGFLQHLKKTKKKFDPLAFKKSYFMRFNVPYKRLADGREMRLMKSDMISKASREQLQAAMTLPAELVKYQDYILGSHDLAKSLPPDYVDHRLVQSAVKDQGGRLTCVAHAALAAMEAFREVPNDLSEEYAYHLFMMNYPAELDGGSPQSCTADPGFANDAAADLLSRFAVCEERYWQYEKDSSKFDCPTRHQPPLAARNNCIYKIGGYRLILDPGPVESLENKVAFRAYNGKYVWGDWREEERMSANRPAVGKHETFEIIRLGGSKVALKAYNGKYVCADAGLGHRLIADRPQIGKWEVFQLVSLGGGSVALKAYNGKYVCADGNKNHILVADRKKIGEWETFSQINHLNRFSIKNTDYLECILAAGYNIVWFAYDVWDDNDAARIIDVRLDASGNPMPNTFLHDMLIVGYNRNRQYFIVKNSAGRQWGHNGYGYFHYDYVKTYGRDGFFIKEVNVDH